MHCAGMRKKAHPGARRFRIRNNTARMRLPGSQRLSKALRQTRAWVARLQECGAAGEVEQDLAVVAFGDYLSQLAGGIPMSQGEFARLSAFGLAEEGHRIARKTAGAAFVAASESGKLHERIAGAMAEGGTEALFDRDDLGEDTAIIRDQFRRFARERVAPVAHQWHLSDSLIPSEVLKELSALGVFGVTVPTEFGGSGLGKLEMCVISEELSRGYIGVGSLGTRSEIAAELILGDGTAEQKSAWLPGIASGEVIPTAVFTEPDTGSDLGALSTRAERGGEGWIITGAKNWITHAARANLMTLLARTDSESRDHRGLSMFLAPKTPATDADPFPDPGINGSEIGVLGYRGMKEYALSFDGYALKDDALLGGRAGEGFRQLMRTFESARIQTAARSVGVARSALDLGLAYALDRRQFGRALIAFPRFASTVSSPGWRPRSLCLRNWHMVPRAQRTLEGDAIWRQAWPSCWRRGWHGRLRTTHSRSMEATASRWSFRYPGCFATHAF